MSKADEAGNFGELTVIVAPSSCTSKALSDLKVTQPVHPRLHAPLWDERRA
jgi:hypothetical protein